MREHRNSYYAFVVGLIASIFIYAYAIAEKFVLGNYPFIVAVGIFSFPFAAVIGYTVISRLFKSTPTLVQVFRFALIGFSNFCVDAGLLAVLAASSGVSSGFAIVPLNIVTVLAAMLNSYHWNRVWTFQSNARREAHEFSTFVVISLVGITMNSTIVYLMTTFIAPSAGIAENFVIVFAKISATLIVMTWNFLGYKYVVFKVQTTQKSQTVQNEKSTA